MTSLEPTGTFAGALGIRCHPIGSYEQWLLRAVVDDYGNEVAAGRQAMVADDYGHESSRFGL